MLVGFGTSVKTQSKPKPSAFPTKKALTDAKSLAAGKAIFENQASLCVTCHRPDLGGVVGPNLTDDFWLHGCGVTDVMKSIRQGYPVQGMMPYGGGKPINEADLHRLASYVLSRRGSAPVRPKPRDPARDKPCK